MSALTKLAIAVVSVLFLGLVIRLVRRLHSFRIPALLTVVIDNPVRRRLQPPALVTQWIGIVDGMQVLEIGPGSGTLAIAAARRVGSGHVHVVDIDAGVIQRLSRRVEKEELCNVSGVVGTATELPYSDQSFDRVFMIAVLGEIADKQRALAEIRRVLNPEGILAVGELVPDPDYPRRRSVIEWCQLAGFELISTHQGFLHYLLTFSPRRRPIAGRSR